MRKLSVSHFVGLSGVGGVQKNFIEYLKYIDSKPGNFHYKIYTLGEADSQYKSETSVNILNIKNVLNFLRLVKDLLSKDIIVHFYNNLSSFKVAFLLFFIPTRKLIFHERGTAWNQKKRYGFVTRFNAKKASVVLANSNATKTILTKKFFIPNSLIVVIHNGVNIQAKANIRHEKNKNKKFRVGFIGRLDSPKGVHVLIDSIQNLSQYDVELFIAGDGPLYEVLKDRSSSSDNITFLDRIQNICDFFSLIDLLVVPSIREPLGNVCLEAGLHKTPVLASNVDGIPEIIVNGISGELLKPNVDLTIDFVDGMAPIPEYVVDPETQNLIKPKQLDINQLSNRILELRHDSARLQQYGLELHRKVSENFSISRYSALLEGLYKDVFDSKY